jgi:hypothetical protein
MKKKTKPTAKSKAASYPASICGMDNIGSLIMRRFPGIGIQVKRDVIYRWRNLLYVPDGCTVPFPAPTVHNRYNVVDCFAWIETYFPNGGQATGLPDKQRTKDQIEEKKLALLNLELAKAEGQVIDRQRARATRLHVLTLQNNIIRARLERAGPQLRIDWLRQLGAAPELIAEFQRRDTELAQRTISEIYEDYAAESRKEPEVRLAEEMKTKTVKV